MYSQWHVNALLHIIELPLTLNAPASALTGLPLPIHEVAKQAEANPLNQHAAQDFANYTDIIPLPCGQLLL